MTWRPFGLVVAGLLALVACGSGGGSGSTGDIPITQRAIAAVALERLPDDSTTREATFTDDSDPKSALGADIRYGGTGESDGDLLRVFISPKVTKKPCAGKYDDGCVERKVDGGTLVLQWQEEEPEEDPGFVAVTLQRPDQEISVGWFGDLIEGDPRKQKLKISIDAMEAIAQDHRLGLKTSQTTIDAGKALKGWQGGEPDPTASDRVDSTDESLINSYWSEHGGYGAFHDRSSSPLKSQFGPDAVGGRFTAEGDYDAPAQTIDVLAASRGPSWLAGDVCDTKRFVGRCKAYSGGRYFAWVPGPAADGGVVWMFQKRENEIVAIRKSGFTVPKNERKAKVQADWYFADTYLKDKTLGLKTDKEMLDLNLGFS